MSNKRGPNETKETVTTNDSKIGQLPLTKVSGSQTLI